MGSGAISVRLERGQLHELHRGVYVVGFRRISTKGRWMGAVLACGPGAVLSHRSAARLWRLIPPRAEPVDVAAPNRQVRREGIEAHRCQLRDGEWLTRDAIPVTSPFRTIFDLAAVVKMRRALLESRAPGGITRNEFEEAFVALVDRFGLQRPRKNAPLAIRGRFFEIDALWERERVAVELDSRSIHGTHKKFESDRLRDRILVAEGWRTMRITWRQLQEEPEAIAEDLAQALGQGHHPHPPGK
jgi:hypothetical protein